MINYAYLAITKALIRKCMARRELYIAAFRRNFTCWCDLMRTAASDRHYRFRELGTQLRQLVNRNDDSCMHNLQTFDNSTEWWLHGLLFPRHDATIQLAAHINYCSLSESKIENHRMQWAVSNEYSQYRFIQSQQLQQR